ncbi:MAG: ornithine cyclodeaminase family protein [Rhodospirillales bacterium]|nr:ornithine cyclodeaminase family protein [Rhodospirillales bacterium]
MKLFDAANIAKALPYGALVDAIGAAFSGGVTVPVRAHHDVPVDDGQNSTILLMPAWSDDGFIGVKTVVVTPENASKGLPAVQATYQLFDRETGQPLALMDGPELTARRTACASALAARYLAAENASKLLMIGTGVLGFHLPQAHAAVRPIKEVRVWGRNPENAEKSAAALRAAGLAAEMTEDLSASVEWADIVSAATLAKEPIIDGNWLRPGQHVDLVGAFRPDMREADDTVLRRARVFCDTKAGAMKEAGDLCDPLARGVISEQDVLADLFELSAGDYVFSRGADDITMFKSAGTAIEDLAAAMLAYARDRG